MESLTLPEQQEENPQNPEEQNLPSNIQTTPKKEIERPQKKKKSFLKYLFIGLAVLFGLIIASSILIYVAMTPRLRIGKAISNTLLEKSREVEAEIINFDEKIKTIKFKADNDSNNNGKIDISILKLIDPQNHEEIKISFIADSEYTYTKVSHNKMTQLLNQFLTNVPEFSNSEPLENIKRVLLGDYWLRENKEFNASTEESPPKLMITAFGTFFTFPFSIDSVEREKMDNEDVYIYTLNPNENMSWKFTQEYTNDSEFVNDSEEFISPEDLEYLARIVKETENIEDTKIILIIKKEGPYLKELSLELPPLGGDVKEVSFEEVALKEITPARYVIQKIVNKTNQDPSSLSKIISVAFSQKSPDYEVEVPDLVVDLEEKDPEIKNLILMLVGMFLMDSELHEQSYSEKNLFNTKAHETKLLFNQGKYNEMLASSEEMLNLVTNQKEKSIAHYWLGLSHYKLGNLDAAEAALVESTKLDETSAGPYVTLAAIAYSRSQAEKGLEYALKCAELDPDYAWCYNNIGLGYLYTGEYQKGIENLEKAVAMDPLSNVFADNLKRAREAGPSAY